MTWGLRVLKPSSRTDSQRLALPGACGKPVPTREGETDLRRGNCSYREEGVTDQRRENVGKRFGGGRKGGRKEPVSHRLGGRIRPAEKEARSGSLLESWTGSRLTPLFTHESRPGKAVESVGKGSINLMRNLKYKLIFKIIAFSKHTWWKAPHYQFDSSEDGELCRAGVFLSDAGSRHAGMLRSASGNSALRVAGAVRVKELPSLSRRCRVWGLTLKCST